MKTKKKKKKLNKVKKTNKSKSRLKQKSKSIKLSKTNSGKKFSAKDKSLIKIYDEYYSDFLKNLMKKFNSHQLTMMGSRELITVNPTISTFFDEFLFKFQTYVSIYYSHLLPHAKVKQLYSFYAAFCKEEGYENIIGNKNDNVFYALSYAIAATGLDNKKIRNMYGVRLGLFG